MAAATITATEYGFECTGGVDATTISSGTLRIKSLAAYMDDDDDTIVLTSLTGATAYSFFKFKANGNDDDAGMSNVYFGEKGVLATGLAVTLNDVDNILYVYLA